MKILRGLTLVTTIGLVLAAQVGAAGGTTTSDYTVASTTDAPGLNTGLVLKRGHPVTVTATGSVCPNTGYCVDPDGTSVVNTRQSSFGGFLLPGAPAYGLVGRVGSGPWVQVGNGPTRLSGTGTLVFAVNDDAFDDNSGGFMVTVSYKESGVSLTSCWPGWGHGDTNHEHCGPPGLDNKPPPPGQATDGSAGERGNSEDNGHGNSQGNGNGHSENGNSKNK
jgi:hypothetical protein